MRLFTDVTNKQALILVIGSVLGGLLFYNGIRLFIDWYTGR